MNIDMKQGAGFALYCVAVLVFAILARIGWEIGAKLWAVF